MSSLNSLISSLDASSVFFVLLSGLFMLLVALLYFQIRTHIRMNRVTYPTYEYVVKQAQDKANEIIHEAMEDARQMKVNAELKGIKGVAKQKVDTQDIEQKYEEALKGLAAKGEEALSQYNEEIKNTQKEQLDSVKDSLNETANRLESQMQKFENQYGNFIQNVSSSVNEEEEEITQKTKKMADSLEESLNAVKQTIKNVEEKQQEVEKIIENNIDNYLEGIKEVSEKQIESVSDKFDKMFEDVNEDIRNQVKQKMENKMNEAQESIDSYRQGWMQMLDTQMLDLVERTTKIALQKGISADEQADLVYSALSEAKQQGVFNDTESIQRDSG